MKTGVLKSTMVHTCQSFFHGAGCKLSRGGMLCGGFFGQTDWTGLARNVRKGAFASAGFFLCFHRLSSFDHQVLINVKVQDEMKRSMTTTTNIEVIEYNPPLLE